MPNHPAVDWSAIDTVLLDMDGTLLDLRYDNWFWLDLIPSRYAAAHGLELAEAQVRLAPKFREVSGTLQWYCIEYWARELDLDIHSIKRESLKRSGETFSDADEERLKTPIREQFERQGHPYYASARLWDDGVIDPLDTRRVLGLALALTRNEAIPETRFGVFRL